MGKNKNPSEKSASKSEQKMFDEFYRTPVGSFMGALNNYSFLLEQMIASHPDDKELPEEYEKNAELTRCFVENFENFSEIEKYYVDDENLLIAILEKIEVEKRDEILKSINTYIQIVERINEEESQSSSVGKSGKNVKAVSSLMEDLLPVVKSFNSASPVFFSVKIEDEKFESEKYAMLLRQVFRFSVKNAQKFIDNPKNETELEFGYEYKNNTLICRTRMKELLSEKGENGYGGKLDFVFDFLASLDEKVKDYFVEGILASFIDCCQSDLDKEKATFENELEYMSLARQVKWAIDKRKINESDKVVQNLAQSEEKNEN